MDSQSKTRAGTVPGGGEHSDTAATVPDASQGQLDGKESESLECAGNRGDSGGTREENDCRDLTRVKALQAKPAEKLAEHAGASVFHADWRALLDVVPECDAVIVDAPYSERTHGAYRDMEEVARRPLAYASWSERDVSEFVSAWAPRCSGWFVTVTDHLLAPAWERALSEAGRYTFSPLAFTAPGSRVRLSGDGPSQWTCWIVVARPKTRDAQKWGALPGAYVLPPGFMDGHRTLAQGFQQVVGGKPLWLMERLVEDYTRPGALVVDPCCGAGTTLVAAQRTGRRAIGGDAMREHAEIAAKRISKPVQAPLFVTGSNEVSRATQSRLFEEGEG